MLSEKEINNAYKKAKDKFKFGFEIVKHRAFDINVTKGDAEKANNRLIKCGDLLRDWTFSGKQISFEDYVIDEYNKLKEKTKKVMKIHNVANEFPEVSDKSNFYWIKYGESKISICNMYIKNGQIYIWMIGDSVPVVYGEHPIISDCLRNNVKIFISDTIVNPFEEKKEF